MGPVATGLPVAAAKVPGTGPPVVLDVAMRVEVAHLGVALRDGPATANEEVEAAARTTSALPGAAVPAVRGEEARVRPLPFVRGRQGPTPRAVEDVAAPIPANEVPNPKPVPFAILPVGRPATAPGRGAVVAGAEGAAPAVEDTPHADVAGRAVPAEATGGQTAAVRAAATEGTVASVPPEGGAAAGADHLGARPSDADLEGPLPVAVGPAQAALLVAHPALRYAVLAGRPTPGGEAGSGGPGPLVSALVRPRHAPVPSPAAGDVGVERRQED